MAKDSSKRQQLNDVLYNAAEALRIITALVYPVMPHAAERIWQQLGQLGSVKTQRIDKLEWGGLAPGTQVGPGEAVFPRVDSQETLERIDAMEQETTGKPAAPPAAAAPAPAAASDKIGIEDFAKVEMRVGLVKTAERVAGADKLLQLHVDIGDEVRQIVAGLALVYKPEQLIGRKVVVVTNLQPRKLRGVESNGMIVAASTPEGAPVLAGFLEDVPVGAKLK